MKIVFSLINKKALITMRYQGFFMLGLDLQRECLRLFLFFTCALARGNHELVHIQ
jgi:hypothetical protein